MIKNAIDKVKDLKENYNNIWKKIIIPRRIEVKENELGKNSQKIKNSFFQKIENNFEDQKNRKIFFSLFYQEKVNSLRKCLIYIHAHSSNRKEGYQLLNFCADQNLDLCLVDLQACGNSEGEFTTLGEEESYSIVLLIKFLQKFYQERDFILWGRSLGAVTAMMTLARLHERISIIGAVFDSPFVSVKKFFMEMIKQTVQLPLFMNEILFKKVREKIKNKIGFDLDSFDIFHYANKIQNIPVVFVYSTKEKFISNEDSFNLFKTLKSDCKELYNCELEHSEERNAHDLQKIFYRLFFQIENFQNTQVCKNNKLFLNPKNLSLGRKMKDKNNPLNVSISLKNNVEKNSNCSNHKSNLSRESNNQGTTTFQKNENPLLSRFNFNKSSSMNKMKIIQNIFNSDEMVSEKMESLMNSQINNLNIKTFADKKRILAIKDLNKNRNSIVKREKIEDGAKDKIMQINDSINNSVSQNTNFISSKKFSLLNQSSGKNIIKIDKSRNPSFNCILQNIHQKKERRQYVSLSKQIPICIDNTKNNQRNSIQNISSNNIFSHQYVRSVYYPV